MPVNEVVIAVPPPPSGVAGVALRPSVTHPGAVDVVAVDEFGEVIGAPGLILARNVKIYAITPLIGPGDEFLVGENNRIVTSY